MMKKFVTAITMFAAMLYAAASFAAVDVNKATAAELDAVKGIGPSTAAKIVEARKAGNFKDWADFESRVAGIKDKKSAALSAAGLTVNGVAYAGAPAAAPKSDTKASKVAPASASAPAAGASAPASKADAKAAAKAQAAANKQAKADAKAKAKADKDAAKAAKTANAPASSAK